MTSTSLSLLDRARTDSESDAWRELTEIYTPLLHTWMHRYSLQASDREDLVQEVLLAVTRELPQFEHSGHVGAFRRWLKTILVHRLQNAWRSRPQRPEVKGGSSFLDELKQLEDDASDLCHLWNVEHDRHVLARLLQKIRPRFEERTWRAFRQVMFDGRKTTDVAVELGLSLKAVHLAKSRVLRALRTEAIGLIPDGGFGSILEKL
ncbi:MAG: RNA polymerase sigma factor [Planctomycetota bacterium]|nr:RNA polymerase sigma factor [Planctomycetota bacterium]